MLHPLQHSKRHYNHKDFEELMFYFNTELRGNWFPHDSSAEGMDHCYDCSAEIFILCEYLKKRGLTNEKDLLRESARLTYEMHSQVRGEEEEHFCQHKGCETSSPFSCVPFVFRHCSWYVYSVFLGERLGPYPGPLERVH
jgi:hypothetical protein